ncbi:glycoside hydrolase family 12 protein [Acidomyces richmondensis BFW]|nr:MAG: glycoside hydrolase family 12 protein [Acidomyces sp. 'richmondensis']KYG47496.1 glycoside hydrolase family 12 protein [Acidomyces richmondensis BFW]
MMHSFAFLFLLAMLTRTLAMPTFTTISRRSSTAAKNLCGTPDDYEIIKGTPWIVYNMMYNYQDMKGSCCTGFSGLVMGTDDKQKCRWNSTWNIEDIGSTSNIPKGYSFVGLTQNLENKLDDIASIPTTYHWVRRNDTAYKGNVCFDFMTSDTKGDSTSTAAQELMLWLRYEGGQLPIGYSSGPVATIELYNKNWTLYQGVNENTGITVSSLLVDEADQYYGFFHGDIKEWLMAMANQGIFRTSTYVNVGNAGMEPFYGTVSFENEVSMQINLS